MQAICILVLSLFFTSAAPRGYGYEDPLKQLQSKVEALRHEVSNHESEIRMAEERANNQEATISSLRQQLLDSNQASKEHLKGSAASIDSKVANLESFNKGIAADIVQLKSHANESSSVLAQYKQKINELEKIIDVQTQNIEHLQAAIKSLTEVLGGAASSEKTYKIKPGDSLEKIARANHTTIKAIKELNHLSNDRIVVGQTLQLP